MSQQHAIVARGLSKRFKTGRTYIQVLKSVDFEALHGEVTMVMGPSGSGKSTLVASLSGLLKPDAGSVSAMGEDLWSYKPGRIDRFRLDHCGFIFQGFNLFPALTAVENVAIAIRMKNPRARNADAEARRLLELVDLGPRIHHLPADLSGGQKQRVAIARALGGNPPIIVGDEPTAALDTRTALSVMELLRELATSQRRAVVVVTHDPRLERFADRVVRVEDGRIEGITHPGHPGHSISH